MASLESQRFPWEKLYHAAALETDDAQLKERIGVAEEAMMGRLLELTSRQEHRAEVRAVEEALKGLAVLKWERLGIFNQSRNGGLPADA